MQVVILTILNYLVGSVSSAIIIGKVIGKKDIRKVGAKTAGGTNVSYHIGFKWGVLVGVFDFLKGIPLLLLAFHLHISSFGLSLIALFAIIGHCWPIWFKFSGGRGVATYLGVSLVLIKLFFVIPLVLMAISLPMKNVREFLNKKFNLYVFFFSSPIFTILSILGLIIGTSLFKKEYVFYSVAVLFVILFRRVSANLSEYKNTNDKLSLFFARILFDNNELRFK